VRLMSFSWLYGQNSVDVIRFPSVSPFQARSLLSWHAAFRFGIMHIPRQRGRVRDEKGCMDRSAFSSDSNRALALLSEPVRGWFEAVFPEGPTPAQEHAWPPIAAGEHVLLLSPTGTGKTLAAFLAILDRLFRAHQSGTLARGLRCVYVSPLRSLNYDIERNLSVPLEGIRARIGCDKCPVQVGVRTGDTSAYDRRKLRDQPPHVLVTTPESLSLLLSQSSWQAHWRHVEHIVVDEVHSLAPTKRGADLAVSLERLTAFARHDPIRVGLSATCRDDGTVARFLVGPSRRCRVIQALPPADTPPMEIKVQSLIRHDEAPHRGLSYRRLLRRLKVTIVGNRTTVIFANTRAFAEKLTHDLRHELADRTTAADSVAAHHSALDATRRRAIERALRDGELRAVVTSTSLELGVDIGTADVTVQVGLPGGVARCVQRVGRSGHRRGAGSRGLLLAATPAELAGAIITARAALAGRVEPLRMILAPLDVVCQQLVSMACAGEMNVDHVFELFRKTGPMAELARVDFDACLAALAGDLPAPAGALEPEPGATPRWTSPRIWIEKGWFGIRGRRVVRWFRSNVGTIHSEETVRVMDGGMAIGTLEASYAERLISGDRFVLDGRVFKFRRLENSIVHARSDHGEPNLPRWTSDRQSLSFELAQELAAFREEAGQRLMKENASGLREWIMATFDLAHGAAAVLTELFEAQAQWSEVPDASGLLVEESPAPDGDGLIYTFHAPLHRAACEALGRATAARLGRRFGRNLALSVADLGWSIRIDGDATANGLELTDIGPLFYPDGFTADVLEGVDRGELPARRFQQVAATGLMVLRNPEPGRRVRVGGLNWVSTRLYPLVKAACPDHPLLRETRREVLDDLLDVPAALRWLDQRPMIRFRSLPSQSPFAAAWIEPGQADSLQFESPADALHRLHERLTLQAAAK
jgi:ATP-dependent helicase Lhr and Lhr-like helicase